MKLPHSLKLVQQLRHEMDWKVERAKNGELTLILNGYYLYSKYNPQKDAETFIFRELQENTRTIIIFGLGLGYHVQALLEKNLELKIFVIVADQKEIKLCQMYGDKEVLKRIIVVNDAIDLPNDEETQVIIPISWLKAIGSHPLVEVLEDIKMKQMSYQATKEKMYDNFIENIEDAEPFISKKQLGTQHKIAVLVSSGPSLNELLPILKTHQNDIYILVVGSALKVLLKNNIIPNAVIISDPQDNIVFQLKDSQFNGMLYYLCTANAKAVSIHTGEKQIVFQNGYAPSEEIAKKNDLKCFETGGSVATLAFSMLASCQFEAIILVGQDLGFAGDQTHAVGSTSGVNVKNKKTLKQLIDNSGEMIYTNHNLNVYYRWFNEQVPKAKTKIYNTALHGAKITGAPYITQVQFEYLIDNHTINY